MQTLIAEALLLVACLAAAVFTFYAAKQAVNSALDLEKSRAKIAALEAAFDSLTAQHLKLRGAFYQFRWQTEQEQAPDDGDAPVRPDGSSRDVCENWRTAQLEGPYSVAASCECDYCTAMRERRRAPQPVVLSGRKPQ